MRRRRHPKLPGRRVFHEERHPHRGRLRAPPPTRRRPPLPPPEPARRLERKPAPRRCRHRQRDAHDGLVPAPHLRERHVHLVRDDLERPRALMRGLDRNRAPGEPKRAAGRAMRTPSARRLGARARRGIPGRRRRGRQRREPREGPVRAPAAPRFLSLSIIARRRRELVVLVDARVNGGLDVGHGPPRALERARRARPAAAPRRESVQARVQRGHGDAGRPGPGPGRARRPLAACCARS